MSIKRGDSGPPISILSPTRPNPESEEGRLVIQTDQLSEGRHPTTIIILGTSKRDGAAPADHFPPRVRVQRTGSLSYDTLRDLI